MRRSAALAMGAAAALAPAGCGGAGDDEQPAPRPAPAERAAQAPPAIGRADIEEHLRALERIARRHGGNRAAGTAGEMATIDYVAEHLRRAGWRVETQAVRWPIFENRRRPVLGGLRYRRDFVEAEYSRSASLTARVRPLDTRACSAAELGDLTRRDVVIVARGTCTFRAKALNAQRAGAGAVVVVDRRARSPVQATLGDPAGIRIPVLSATGSAGARLARAGGSVRVVVDSISETRETRNVIAETTPGSGVVMAGGHLDSVEAGPGVNDNGSGIAALLELAQRLRDRPGLRLGFWTAEEPGLFGSRHYVRTLAASERRRIRAYINLDMVGTPDERIDVYDGDNPVERALRSGLAGRESETDIGGDSDHAPFERRGVRVGGLFTGVNRCYHRRCDTLRNTDAATAARAARGAQAALTRLAR